MPMLARNVTAAEKLLVRHSPAFSTKIRVTLDELNAGIAFPAERGGYRLSGGNITARGATATGGTNVDVTGTLAGSAVQVLTALTSGLAVDTPLAFTTGSAVNKTLDYGKPISIVKTGTPVAASSHFDVVLNYSID